ncbi:MAG TPA: dTDP-glucose 4,6-dehydratase [Candidatus Binatia bacterium]|jgi:dTDP-glucose 4,6-dehydratase|nr:dTDP-glucose 4,6-dehydratase [Candidatus Binatia bacterium]
MRGKTKTVLVTGGAGFMGSNFVRYLLRKYPRYKVIVLDALTYAGNTENLPKIDNQNSDGRFSFWYGNIRNGELIDSLVSQSQIVFHFAAETHVTRSIYDNQLFFETDVLGTQVVANAVLKYSKSVERFIHISSSEVYGTAMTEFMDEDHPLMPTSPYAGAKAGADRLVYSYWTTYDIPAVIVRPFNNYGPYQHLEKVIPRFITSCILNEPLTVHGDGKSQRDWLYVEDFCRALEVLMHCDFERVGRQVINVGTGRSTDILTIAELVLKKMKRPRSLIKYIGDRPGQVFRHTASIAKAHRLLGWSPMTELEEGLDKTIDWYQKNQKWWEKMLWMRAIPIVTKKGSLEYH